MLIFYGLGNNEAKYLQTKHNAGRLAVESLAKKSQVGWQKQPSYTYAKTVIDDQNVFFLLSSGYMNNSGQPLSALVNYFKLDFTDKKSNLVVLHDDSDQIEGNLKLLPAGGSGGHKGIQSIYEHSLGMNLPIEQVWRLKIGIRPPLNREKSETFVLSGTTKAEAEFFENLGCRLYDLLPTFLKGDFGKIQTEINTQKSV